MRSIGAAMVMAVATVAGVSGQQKASGDNPVAAGIARTYESVKGYIMASAELVPEERYSYQPTKDVRTFGQILAHIVDAQNNVCAAANGDVIPYADVTEKTVTNKADLLAKLRESFAACDAVYATTTDAALSNRTQVFGSDASVAQALALNATHDWEHYGNLVTYMRMMGIVPPSSR